MATPTRTLARPGIRGRLSERPVDQAGDLPRPLRLVLRTVPWVLTPADRFVSPAAYCGTVGLKPTYGRVSRYGVIPLSWSLDHVGPLSRSVRDAALILDAISAPDPRDPTATQKRPTSAVDTLDSEVAGLRVGVVDELFAGSVQPSVRDVALVAIDQLSARDSHSSPSP